MNINFLFNFVERLDSALTQALKNRDGDITYKEGIHLLLKVLRDVNKDKSKKGSRTTITHIM